MRRSIRGWGGAGIAQWNSPTTKAPEDQRTRPSASQDKGSCSTSPEPTVPVKTGKG